MAQSHGTKSTTLSSKLHSRTSETKTVHLNWFELLCFGSPTMQHASHHGWFVPRIRSIPSVIVSCKDVIHWYARTTLYKVMVWMSAHCFYTVCARHHIQLRYCTNDSKLFCSYHKVIGHFQITSLVPLFLNESSSKTFLMKMNLICIKMNLYADHIFIWIAAKTAQVSRIRNGLL